MATRTLEPVATVWGPITAAASLALDPLEMSAAAEWGAVSAPAELDLTNVKAVSAAVAWGPVLAQPFTDLDLVLTQAVVAAVEWGAVSATADLDLFRNNGVAADAQIGTWNAPVDLTLVPVTGYVDYVETQAVSLFGDIDVCIGPGGSLVVAGGEGRSIGFLATSDPKRLYMAHERAFDARPLSVAANDDYWFVLLEQTQSPDPAGQPELKVFPSTSFAADEVASLRLPRDIEPRFLWAADDGPDDVADFLIVTGADGAVQIRKADDTLELLAEAGTGIYEPRVVECIRQEDLENSDENGPFTEHIWNILVFSERSARGVVLQYRDVSDTTTISAAGDQADNNIGANVEWSIGTVNHLAVDTLIDNNVSSYSVWGAVTAAASLSTVHEAAVDVEWSIAAPAELEVV